MKSGIARYGFLNARLRALLANLRDSDIIGKLMRAGSFIQALEALDGTEYAPLTEIYRKTGDLQMMERALLEDQIAIRREVCASLDGKSAAAAGFFLIKIELDNLKSIIRIWYDSHVLGGRSGYRLNYILRSKIASDIQWDSVINSQSWDEIVKSLEPTAYGAVAASFSGDDIVRDGLVYFEMALDFWYYKSFLGAAGRLGRHDRKVASAVIHEDLELKNMLILIRYGFYYSVPSGRLRGLLLPGGGLYSDKALESCFSSVDPIGELKSYLIAKYPQFGLAAIFASETKAELLSRSFGLEKLLYEERSRRYRDIMQGGDPFNFGLIMACFFQYDRYDDSIRIILHGKYYQWPEQRIMEVLG